LAYIGSTQQSKRSRKGAELLLGVHGILVQKVTGTFPNVGVLRTVRRFWSFLPLSGRRILMGWRLELVETVADAAGARIVVCNIGQN